MNTRRAARIVVSSLALAASLVALAACSTPPRSPVDSAGAYDGPPASIQAMTGRHIAVFAAPTGGWSVSFDDKQPAYRETHIFVTLRRPDPTLMVSQAQVEHRVDTTVELEANIGVFARVLEHGAEPVGVPYRRAATAQGAR